MIFLHVLNIVVSKKWYFKESWRKTARPAKILGRNGPARPSPLEIWGRNGPARPGPAEILGRAGPVMLNFISIRTFKRLIKENLNFIINSFQIKYYSLKKMADISEIFAEYWQKTARPGPQNLGA